MNAPGHSRSSCHRQCTALLPPPGCCSGLPPAQIQQCKQRQRERERERERAEGAPE
ncbi:unnamed protein product [Spirodela intermedia]|uniref:Uncharacterized protein n=1 Tax=Spirodela intermedia TaxID=51605 RepID=A0A7I8JM99_SPIIN|nr:unnamed protein product [Spirodela intermedia]CAA6670931.1 unnamed protein product [Spirodela intermedia]